MSIRAIAFVISTSSLILVIACSISQVHAPTSRQPDNVSSSISEPDDSYIRWLFKTQKFRTVEEFLNRIAVDFPDYFHDYTLAYQSLSVQDSSFENPRAIVYGKTAHLILTFNGDPSQNAYGNVEMMSFDEAKGFQFRDIQFLKEPNSGAFVRSEEVEFKSDLVQISKANPQVCMECHGPAPARPIWEPYFNWPGMYGSNDDSVVVLDNRPSISRLIKLLGPDVELEGYQKFQINRPQNPRYAHLSEHPDGIIEKHGPIADQLDYHYFFDRQTNFKFMLLLAAERDAILFRDIMAKHPTTEQLTLLAGTLCMPSDNNQVVTANAEMKAALDSLSNRAASRLPVFVQDQHDVAAEDLARMNKDFNGKLDTSVALPELAQYSDGQEDYRVAQALAELGIPLQKYSLNLRRKNWYFTALDSDFAYVRNLVLQRLSKYHLTSVTCRSLGFAQPIF